MKIKGYRARYFEDYIKKTVVGKNGREKIQYVYAGVWYRWGLEGFDAMRQKRLYLLIEAASIAVYLAAALQDVAVNRIRLASGLGLLALLLWLFELRGVYGFLRSKTYVTRMDYMEIDTQIRLGGYFRAALLASSALYGTVACLRGGGMDLRSWAAEGCYLASLTCSAVIARIHGRLHYRTYKNKSGEVGEEF